MSKVDSDVVPEVVKGKSVSCSAVYGETDLKKKDTSRRGGMGRYVLVLQMSTVNSCDETCVVGSEVDAKAAQMGRPGPRVQGLTAKATLDNAPHAQAMLDDVKETAQKYTAGYEAAECSSHAEFMSKVKTYDHEKTLPHVKQYCTVSCNRGSTDVELSEDHTVNEGHQGSVKVSILTMFEEAAQEASNLGTRGCGGVGPFIGSKRKTVVGAKVDEKHTARNVDEGDLGVPTDCLTTEGDLSSATEVTVTGVHVTGVQYGSAHTCVEHLSVASCSQTVTDQVCEAGSSGKNTSGMDPRPDTETKSGVGVPARGEEMVSTYLTEGQCGELMMKLLPFVNTGGGHRGRLMNANNAEMHVLTFATSAKGVKRHVQTGNRKIEMDEKGNRMKIASGNVGMKAPVSVGQANNAGSAEALTGMISCETTHDTGGGTLGGYVPKVAQMGGLLGGRTMVENSDMLTDHTNSGKTGLTTGLGGTTASLDKDRTFVTVKPHSGPMKDESRGKRMFRCTGMCCTSETSEKTRDGNGIEETSEESEDSVNMTKDIVSRGSGQMVLNLTSLMSCHPWDEHTVYACDKKRFVGIRMKSHMSKTMDKRKGRMKRVCNRLANVTVGIAKQSYATDAKKRTKRGVRTIVRLPKVTAKERDCKGWGKKL